ncbi:MAG: hypothetical protein ABR507_07945 [Actinomycetota bacterium]|nr:hypothetical protein [Actinomycetota bacterium]
MEVAVEVEPEVGIFRIKIDGEDIQPGKVSLRDLKDLIEKIQSGVERVARVMLGDPGSAPGPLPKNIKDATELLLVGVETGSAVLSVELAPQAEENDSAQLFQSPSNLGLRAVDSFVQGLHQLETQPSAAVPNSWDNSVMEVAESLFQLTQERNFSVTLTSQIPQGQEKSARVSPDNVDRFQIRHAPIRRPRTARGTLIMVDLETGRVDVKPEGGRRVQCVFPEELRPDVERLIGQSVEARGEEEYDVALNKASKLEISTMGPAGEQERLDADFWRNPSLAELAETQGIGPIRSLADLPTAEISDEDFEVLAESLRASRSDG